MKRNWKYKTVWIFVRAKRSRYLKQTLRGWRIVDISNLLLPLSQEPKITFSPLTQFPPRCACSAAGHAYDAQWTLCTARLGVLKFHFDFFASVFLASELGEAKSREYGRVKYDKARASERASYSFIHGRWSKRSPVLHGKIKSNRFHWRDTILGVVVPTRYEHGIECFLLASTDGASGYILTFVFLSPFSLAFDNVDE